MAQRKAKERSDGVSASTEAKIDTDPNESDVVTWAVYQGETTLRRIGPCCVEVFMGKWHFQLTSAEAIRLTADHDDGRKFPSA